MPQRQLLINWLKHNTTGNNRIRCATPEGWVVGDKTGTGEYGTTNDVAIVWPKKGKPIIMAVYFRQFKKNAWPNNKVIQNITRFIVVKFKRSKILV